MRCASSLVRILVLAPFALIAVGCTEPQSGLIAKTWCLPTDANTYVVLDDFEDGDAVPCTKSGGWSVGGAGQVTPAAGGPAPGIALLADDLTKRAPSQRGLHLSGTVDSGGYASLLASLSNVDLSVYKEVDFWTRSEGSGEITLRVAVTTTSSAGAPFFTTVTVSPDWGESGNNTKVNNVPLLGALLNAAGTTATAEDLASSTSIEFQYQSADNASTTFGFWLDDIQFKKN